MVLASIVIACGGQQDATRHGSNSQGQGTGANACEGKPVPAHECVGGVPAPRCNIVNGEPRWQIDCVPPDPNAPPDTRSVSNCQDHTTCGPEPAWDASDCLYGFAGDTASCESIDRNACTWSRRCRPKPCSIEEGTCNVLHEERLGAPCSMNTACPSGSTCGTVSVDIGNVVGPVCIPEPTCDVITCAHGKTCAVLESYPVQLVCSKM